jgi:hypothetical protein
MTTTTTTRISEPAILTANTYFWSPASSASSRRGNESRHLREVAEWFEGLGMTVTEHSGAVEGSVGEITARFSYSESCRNVYRSLSITRGGRRSNITALRKLA